MNRDSADTGTGTDATDEALVLAALVGDLAAFGELVRRYRAAVTLVAQQIVGSRAAAEDLAQDVFVAAFQALPNLEEPARFGAWVRAIARFRALRFADREHRVRSADATALESLVDAAHAAEARDADPALRSADRYDRDAVHTALEQLTEEYHEVLYLHYCEEWSIAKISEFLGVPSTTVKGRLFRARDAFRKQIERTDEARSALRSSGNTEGRTNDEHNRRQQPRAAADPPAAEADVQHGAGCQSDRRIVRGGCRCRAAV
jgi:RNA polymerase sigma-70 factor (ECF subfamily)